MFKRRRPDEIAGNEPVPPQAGEAGASEAVLDGAGLAAPPGPADSGLGVPPYRPATPKEAPPMGRAPYPTATNPTGSPAGNTMGGPVPQAPSMPTPRTALQPARPQRDQADRRTLVVGRGISLQGTVQDAERLVVEGTVEASMIHASELAIAQGGMFKGEVEVEDAEIAGTIDGTLTARGNLIVRATGRVLGTARCRRLQVEDGGQITGRIEMITEPSPRAEAPRQPEQLSA